MKKIKSFNHSDMRLFMEEYASGGVLESKDYLNAMLKK
jgi:hypothetical protein